MTAARRRCASSSLERGFTLLELLVVLGVLALALAVVSPSLGRARLGVLARSTAYELAANLRASRAAARATSIEHALTIDLSQRLYWAEGVVGRRPLPPGVVMEVAVPQSERIAGAVSRIRFFPDGSASGARLVLHDERSTMRITVDWLTGDVRLR
jgi:general secretion pathway protein H